MGPVSVLMVISTISWELTAICCQELVRIRLLMNVAARVLLGLLWWVEGSRGYRLWLARVLPRKSMYGS